MNTSLTLTYTPEPEDDADDSDFSFALEQEEYPSKSAANFTEWAEEQGAELTASNVMQMYEQYLSSCTADGALEVGLRVYLPDMTTEYNLVASYGALSEGELVEDTVTERVELDISDAQSVEFGTITAVEFEGDVRDSMGVVTATPDLSFDGHELTVSEAVDATVAITTATSYWHYTLTIQPRDVSEEELESDDFDLGSLYASTVKLYCNEQKETLEIEMPENFGTCEGGYSISGSMEDDDEEDDAEYAVMFEAFDYCTGDPIEGADFVVDGSFLTDPSSEMILDGSEHTVVVTAEGYQSSADDDLDENDTFTLSASDTDTPEE